VTSAINVLGKPYAMKECQNIGHTRVISMDVTCHKGEMYMFIINVWKEALVTIRMHYSNVTCVVKNVSCN